MRKLGFVLLLVLPAAVRAQIMSAAGGSNLTLGDVAFRLRSDPPGSQVLQAYSTVAERKGNDSASFLHRYFVDNAHHVYFGYEVLVEPQQPSGYLLTFGPLGLTPLEMAIGQGSSPFAHRLNTPAQAISRQWTMQPLPSLPPPRMVQARDTTNIEVMVDPATGQKLIDEIEIRLRLQPLPPPVLVAPGPVTPARIVIGNRIQSTSPYSLLVPTVRGDARDFSPTDAEMQLQRPVVSLNGTPQDSIVRVPMVRGPLVWIYLPHHGRYILSLAERPGLDFQKAGEVRGGTITFKLGEETIKIESSLAIAPGNAPYFLYVLHDPDWQPTAAGKEDAISLGSVSVEELLALKRK